MPNEEAPRSARSAESAPEPIAKRDVVITGQFKRDMKREQRGPHRAAVRAAVQAAVDLLAADVPLPGHMVDHPLGGNWKHHRDCHVRPDPVLIHRKSDVPRAGPSERTERPKLHLVRIGSHSELGI